MGIVRAIRKQEWRRMALSEAHAPVSHYFFSPLIVSVEEEKREPQIICSLGLFEE